MPFNQQFTVPRELTLRTGPRGVQLCTNPVAEVASLRAERVELESTEENGATVMTPKVGKSSDYNLLDVELELEVGDAKRFDVELRGLKIECDLVGKTMTHGEVTAPLDVIDGRVKFRLILDRASLEIFANDGLSQIAKCFVPEDENSAPILRASGEVKPTARVWTMSSVWR